MSKLFKAKPCRDAVREQRDSRAQLELSFANSKLCHIVSKYSSGQNERHRTIDGHQLDISDRTHLHAPFVDDADRCGGSASLSELIVHRTHGVEYGRIERKL